MNATPNPMTLTEADAVLGEHQHRGFISLECSAGCGEWPCDLATEAQLVKFLARQASRRDRGGVTR